VKRALVLGLLCSGCVPFAYVLPPLDVTADLGLQAPMQKLAPVVNLGFGVRPLALLPSLHERRDDFALGYTVTVTPAPLIHGPYAEYTRVLWGERTDERHLWRLRGGGVARLLYDTAVARFGAQVGLRVIIESTNFIDSDFESQDSGGWLVGHALGELGVGLYAEAGAIAMPSTVAFAGSLGVIFTVPASAGVGFAWLK
jgi:hypothetical protein